LTAPLPHVGHCSCRSRVGDRTSFSNLAPQPSQTYSKMGIPLPPHLVRQRLADQSGKVVCVYVADHGDPVVDQHQRVRPVALGRFHENAREFRLDLWRCCIMVVYTNPVPEHPVQVHLNQACGLLRRPSGASALVTDFGSAMSQYSDLNLLCFHNTLPCVRIGSNLQLSIDAAPRPRFALVAGRPLVGRRRSPGRQTRSGLALR